MIQQSLANTKVSPQQQWRPLSKEIYGKSSQGTWCWKVHSVGYKAVVSVFRNHFSNSHPGYYV